MDKTGNVSARKLYKTAISLARMYGVKETLEPLPFVQNDIITDKMLAWTEEYLESGSDDMLEFLCNKCDAAFAGKEGSCDED